MQVGLLNGHFQFLGRYLARIVLIHLYKLLLQISDLLSVNHLYQHVHRSLLEYAHSLELVEALKHVPIDLFCVMVVIFALPLNVAEPWVLKCLAGSQPLFRVDHQKFLY